MKIEIFSRTARISYFPQRDEMVEALSYKTMAYFQGKNQETTRRVVSKAGTLDAGHIGLVLNWLEDNLDPNYTDIHILNMAGTDLYEAFDYVEDAIAKVNLDLASNGLILRPEQLNALNKVFLSKVQLREDTILQYRNLVHYAPNSGKSFIMGAMAMIDFEMFGRGTMIVCATKAVYTAILTDCRLLCGEDNVGQVNDSTFTFGRIVTVCMVKSLSIALQTDEQIIKIHILQQGAYPISLLWDECDQFSIGEEAEPVHAFCARIGVQRVTGFTGSLPDKTDIKKVQKYMNIAAYFGRVVCKLTPQELIELGRSLRTKIKICHYTHPVSTNGLDAKVVLDELINRTENFILGAYYRHISEDLDCNKKVLVYARRAEQIKRLYDTIRQLFPKRRIEIYDGKTPKKKREELERDFNDMKIDILVGSNSIERGANLKPISSVYNCADFNSKDILEQIIGRGQRTHSAVSELTYYDFMTNMNKIKTNCAIRIDWLLSQYPEDTTITYRHRKNTYSLLN